MRTPSRVPSLLLPLLLLALAACSGMEVRSTESGVDLGALRSYAWSPPPASDGELLDGPLAASLREAVDGELVARGLREVSLTDADLLVRADVSVELRAVSRHAFNAGFYTLERHEDGSVEITLTRSGSQSPAWQGSAKHSLRLEAQGYGLYEANWVETGEPRDWRMPDVVEAIFERFPVARSRAD